MTDRWTPATETLLHYAARADHIARTIRPALAAGKWVISDRYADSTLAYQGYGHGVAKAFIQDLCRHVAGQTWPDLTVIMDIAAEEGLRRALARKGAETRYEQMDLAFHQRLRAGFQEIAKLEPRRCAVVDAGADIATVQAAIQQVVRERLGVNAP